MSGLRSFLVNPDQAISGGKALVTGGVGFIGSHLADRLVEARASVTIRGDFPNGRESNLTGPASAARVIRVSICDSNALALAMEGAQVVVQLASMGSVPRSVERPECTRQAPALAGTPRYLPS